MRSMTFHSTAQKGDVLVGQIAYVNAHQELFIINEIDLKNVQVTPEDTITVSCITYNILIIDLVQPLRDIETDGVEVVVSSIKGPEEKEKESKVEMRNDKSILEKVLGTTASHVLPSPPMLYSSIMEVLINKSNSLEEGETEETTSDKEKTQVDIDIKYHLSPLSPQIMHQPMTQPRSWSP